jgi:hypothetical protein
LIAAEFSAINQHVAIDQRRRAIRRTALESAAEFGAKPVDVFDAAGHVIAVLPHAGEGRIGD